MKNVKRNGMLLPPPPPAYDFFGNDAPDDDDFCEIDQDEYDAPPNDYSTLYSSNNNNSTISDNSSFRKSPKKTHSPSKSIVDISPSKFMDPGKLEIGRFVGNIRNDGVTGEFDGFNFGHSKIMLNVRNK